MSVSAGCLTLSGKNSLALIVFHKSWNAELMPSSKINCKYCYFAGLCKVIYYNGRFFCLIFYRLFMFDKQEFEQ